jgi:hypothetical protein
LKNVSRDIRAAYEQNFLDYKDTVPHLFHHNAFVVLANGVDAKLGSVTSRFEHFHDWTQIYKTFAGCGVVDNDRDPCRAASGEHLAQLLAQHKSHVFSLIQKFNQIVAEGEAYSRRDDLIVITDEAHRTQYGTLALNMRNALPTASYIGFTGTPLFKDDEITRRVSGDYVSTYDFQRAVEDKATVPFYYDARGDKLGVAVADLNERIGELEAQLPTASDEQDEQYRRRQIEWMRQTQMAVVVSEEQGEVEKFRKWELDITPHRRLIKEGIDLPEAMRKQPQFQNMQRLSLDDAFKAVAVDLLETLKAEKLRINHWRDKEATRDAVRLTIQDYLWSENTGLPEIYSEEDVRDKTEAVFVHVFRVYPTVPSPYYAGVAS